MKNESLAKKLLNHFEVYAGAGIFIIMTILLFVQVVTRYCFGHAVTWAEEVATILFVWMVYLGVAAAVLSRKHLKIDAFVEMLPFKAKKTLLIISNVIFLAFSLYIIFPMMSLVNNYAAKSATSPILKIPKALSYVVMPLCFLLTAIRLVQEIIRLSKEKEKERGVSKPIIDIAALEKEAEELARQKKGGNK
mgnify:FL=1